MATSFDNYARKSEHELDDQVSAAYKAINQMLNGMKYRPSQLIEAPSLKTFETDSVGSKQMTAEAQQSEAAAVQSAIDDEVSSQVDAAPTAVKDVISTQTSDIASSAEPALSDDEEALARQEEARSSVARSLKEQEKSAKIGHQIADDQANGSAVSDLEDDLDLDQYIHSYLEDQTDYDEVDDQTAVAETQTSAQPGSASQADNQQQSAAQPVDSATIVTSSQSADDTLMHSDQTMSLDDALKNADRLRRESAPESQADVDAEEAAASAVVNDTPADDDIPTAPQSNMSSQAQVVLPAMDSETAKSDGLRKDFEEHPEAINNDDFLDEDDTANQSLQELKDNPIQAAKSSTKTNILVGGIVGILILVILAFAFVVK